MAEHNDLGKLGEDTATNFLKKKGLSVIEKNYWKPYGEIDIVARENKLVRFIEVKTVSYSRAENQVQKSADFSRETIRPEDNMHPQKMRRLQRVIEAYVFSHETGDWVFDLICVYVDKKTRSASVKWIKDIILE